MPSSGENSAKRWIGPFTGIIDQFLMGLHRFMADFLSVELIRYWLAK